MAVDFDDCSNFIITQIFVERSCRRYTLQSLWL